MRDVKALRNMLAHKDFALIDQWDPDDPRPDDEFMEMLRSAISGTWEFPEGYRVLDKHKKGSSWIYFDCRKYNCTMRELDAEQRVAAIQLQLVQEIIKGFSSGEIDEYRYRNQI